MADHPIIFSGPMVRAILEGRKTQTRRVLKPQPFSGGYIDREVDCTTVHGRSFGETPCFRFGAMAVGGGAFRTEVHEVPYGQGDRLWVRETWQSEASYDDLSPASFGGEEPLRYAADGSHQTWGYPAISKIGRLRSPLHMPRWASRLTLIVEDVRVQRLQEISETDAKAEGVTHQKGGRYLCGFDDEGEITCRNPVTAFGWLWNSINAKRGYDWVRNPWVVAITFSPIQKNIAEVAE